MKPLLIAALVVMATLTVAVLALVYGLWRAAVEDRRWKAGVR